MTIFPRAGRAAAALAAITLVGAAQPAPDWMLYRAAIAAASGALRLHETSDAKRWLADASAAHRGWEWRYLNSLADESVAARKAHDAAITGLAATPDGRLLATTSADRSVKLWDAQSGAPVATLAGHTAATWSPAFRPGGAHLLTIPYPVQVYGVRFSPDGRTLAVAPMDSSIRLLDAR